MKEDLIQKYTQRFAKFADDANTREALQKQVIKICSKMTTCDKCGALNGMVKQVTGLLLRINHNKYKVGKTSKHSQKEIDDLASLFQEAMSLDQTIRVGVENILEDMNPLKTYNLF